MHRVETVAALDRIEDGTHAVLIIGDPPERELVVPVEQLPQGVREGHWLRVVLEGDQFISAAIDEQATEAAKQRVQGKMERLRRKGRRLG